MLSFVVEYMYAGLVLVASAVYRSIEYLLSVAEVVEDKAESDVWLLGGSLLVSTLIVDEENVDSRKATSGAIGRGVGIHLCYAR